MQLKHFARRLTKIKGQKKKGKATDQSKGKYKVQNVNHLKHTHINNEHTCKLQRFLKFRSWKRRTSKPLRR